MFLLCIVWALVWVLFATVGTLSLWILQEQPLSSLWDASDEDPDVLEPTSGPTCAKLANPPHSANIYGAPTARQHMLTEFATWTLLFLFLLGYYCFYPMRKLWLRKTSFWDDRMRQWRTWESIKSQVTNSCSLDWAVLSRAILLQYLCLLLCFSRMEEQTETTKLDGIPSDRGPESFWGAEGRQAGACGCPRSRLSPGTKPDHGEEGIGSGSGPGFLRWIPWVFPEAWKYRPSRGIKVFSLYFKTRKESGDS